jgi:hypothetical protein
VDTEIRELAEPAAPLAAADVVLCSLLETTTEQAGDRNYDASSDEASNQITDPTAAERDAKEAQQPTRDSGPYDAEHNVHENPHLALHELLGEPAGDSANDDGCYPTDLMLFHLEISPSKAAKLSNPY